ncbi:baseplate J/gp47 family protein [Streptomyces sp. H27-D2]|uniref:baseplate J/gp47 family protein n=1 Tax=Streptomyces sp. H27-D2 TaxID=3046304 RepID=UPI002DB67F26|nr:baseplate J/gp47 family protein [Streptomyces sp. H27-D2]MEC4018809.1 baseplate J/gp47 family protein [Streptomyces sp. H27-D2]
MAEIKRTDDRPVIDYMARDYESLLRAMRDLIPQKLPEWRDFANEADFGNVLLELFAHLGDILSYYQDRVANESFLGTARTRGSVIEHLRLIGYELGTAAPAAASLSLTVPGTVNATVTVSKGDAFATRSQRDRPGVRFEYTREAPLTIDFGAIGADPVTGRKVFGPAQGGIPVEEGRLIKDELLGTSDGTPNQRFPLAHTGLILRPPGPAGQPGRDLLLVTRLAAVTDAWTLRESLAFSQAGQKDYVVEIDADDRAGILFGDGTLGAIPPSGALIRATYRVGGGTAGNVPANAVTTIVGAPQLALLGATVANPAPATGGSGRESIEHAVQHAPAVFRSLRRAVTAADYEALALSFKGVGKVHADATGWNQVTLYVAPEGGGKVSDVLEAGLQGYFEDKRMLSQIVEIADVDYIPVHVTAELAIESFYVRADVVAAVQAAAAGLLAFDRVGFQQTVYLSKFYEETQDVPGVIFVNITEFRRGDRPSPAVDPLGKLALGPNEVPVIPADPDYAPGLKVVVVNQGGQ